MMHWIVVTPGRVKSFKAGCSEEAIRYARNHAQKVRAGWFQLYDHDDNQITMEWLNG